ncbi:DUF58 domain-containing protein [Tuberibacillus sp. Marseille-P3662]|uniref:DUF58 domain-containing protein n=1 Tax=Tuberibacillus sp. Marseille-P3662 TaxID=1965358 RepID=UPI000A1C94BE|nr:DUF58 domain-containing protein [Tuberibacillus sp. Marseille-P3662]
MIEERKVLFPSVAQLITGISILAIFIGYFFEMEQLLVLDVMILLLLLFLTTYLKWIGKDLTLTSQTPKLRMYKGDRSEVVLTIQNPSRWPVISGQLTMSADDQVTFPGIQKSATGHYAVPFKLSGRRERTLRIPVEGLRRGHAKLKIHDIRLYDPFNLLYFQIDFGWRIHSTMVVFPNQKAIGGLQRVTTMSIGEQASQQSLFFDQTQPMGIREYQSTDSSKHIHWKASAKTGELQTKTFERTTRMIWSIVLCHHPVTQRKITMAQLEQQIAYAAHLCWIAEKQGIQIELFCNSKPRGDTLLHLPPDSGRIHLFKALEFLALISNKQIKIRPELAFKDIGRRFDGQRVVFFMNQYATGDQQLMGQWYRQGHKLFRLDLDSGALKRLSGGGQPDAVS